MNESSLIEQAKLKHADEAQVRGEYSTSESLYKEICSSTDANVAFWSNRNLAYALREQRRLGEAIIYAKPAWALRQHLDLGLLLATLYRETRQFSDASHFLAELLDHFKDKAEVHVALGDLAIASGRPIIEAQVSYSLASTINPSHFWARRNNGNCLRQLGDPLSAIAELEAAKALQPADAAILIDLGDAYYECGEIKKSKRLFILAAEQSPNFIWGINTRMRGKNWQFGYVSGWFVSKTTLTSVMARLGEKLLSVALTSAPNPFARRWLNTPYRIRHGFYIYFESEPTFPIHLELTWSDCESNLLVVLGTEAEFQTVDGKEQQYPEWSGDQNEMSVVARRLWKASSFQHLLHFLYRSCDLSVGIISSGQAYQNGMLLLDTLFHEHRFSEAEFVADSLLESVQDFSPEEACHLVEYYCLCYSVRVECGEDMESLKERLNRCIADVNFKGAEGARISLGHLALLEGDFSQAKINYRQAVERYPGKPMAFNYGIYSFLRSDREEGANFTASTKSNDFPVPIFVESFDSTQFNLVHLLACDSKYFQRFVPNLVHSSLKKSNQLKICLHIHLINPTEEALALFTTLKNKGNYADIRLSIESLNVSLSQATLHAYFTTPRFLIAPEIVRRYKCPVIITETDCVMNWSWENILDWTRRSDVGLMLKEADRTLVPGAKVIAQAVYLNNNAQSLAYIRHVAEYIRVGFDFGSDVNWTIDQLALWVAYQSKRSEMKFCNLDRGIIRVPHLNKDLFVTSAE